MSSRCLALVQNLELPSEISLWLTSLDRPDFLRRSRLGRCYLTVTSIQGRALTFVGRNFRRILALLSGYLHPARDHRDHRCPAVPKSAS